MQHQAEGGGFSASPRSRHAPFEHIPQELTSLILKEAAVEGGPQVATLRLICSEWKDIVDSNMRMLRVRAWPVMPTPSFELVGDGRQLHGATLILYEEGVMYVCNK